MSISDTSIIYKNKEALECEISELKSMISEFEQVSQVLNRLPNKVQHEIMVPLGPLAFSPGHIVNTNKVLMLLGSDIYAERTALESRKTINRRLSQARDCLETMNKNLSKIEEALKLKDEFSASKGGHSKTEAEIREEEVSPDEAVFQNITFTDGTAEIREEISDDIDISESFIPPPLPSGGSQKPYIPDSHVEDPALITEADDVSRSGVTGSQGNEVEILDTGVSQLNIAQDSKAQNDSVRPTSIFKQRLAGKKIG
ncbi:prefoldin like molecular chaperone [Cryptosporidium canis]|nr:prefoldin like molecular chaperone [Cryptosporidium canis]